MDSHTDEGGAEMKDTHNKKYLHYHVFIGSKFEIREWDWIWNFANGVQLDNLISYHRQFQIGTVAN